MLDFIKDSGLIFSIFFLFAVPLSSVGFFAFSLVSYIRANIKHKRDSEAFSLKKLEVRKALLIISAIVMGILILVLDYVLTPFMSEISFM